MKMYNLFIFFSVDLKGILYLMKFLQESPSDNHPDSKYFLTTVQSIIQSSCTLKDSIKTFFNQLEMTMDNMESIQYILSSLDQFSIFYGVDKCSYLEKSLSNIHSTECIVKWFQYFLTILTEKDNCKNLFDSAINHLTDKSLNFIQILQSIDILLDILRSCSIDQLVDCCFQQGTYEKETIFTHTIAICSICV